MQHVYCPAIAYLKCFEKSSKNRIFCAAGAGIAEVRTVIQESEIAEAAELIRLFQSKTNE